MGLQSELNDVSTNSLPFLLLSIIATFVNHFRSLFHHSTVPPLSLSLSLSVPFTDKDKDEAEDEDDENVEGKDKCVFCLSRLRDDDRLRELTCKHVFHADCLDGWIGQMKSSCPLCRSPLGWSHWGVDRLCLRVSSWFAVR